MSEYYNDNDMEYCECKAKLCDAKTLTECSNECVKPVGVSGPLVAKIPVVISEPRIQIDVEAMIELEEPALEIKRIKKNLFLTQCKVLNTHDGKKGKLFISGFIRKNIEYATAKCRSHEGGAISGDIRHTTVNVPFECVSVVEFVNPPVFCNSGFVTETEIFSSKFDCCDPCGQKIIGRDFCEQDFKHFECFTEKIFCELEEVKIIEEDIRHNAMPIGCKYPNEQVFKNFIEKMVIFIKLKLLQKQQVNIPTSGYCDDDKDYKKYDDHDDYTDKWPWLKYYKKDKEKKYGNQYGGY